MVALKEKLAFVWLKLTMWCVVGWTKVMRPAYEVFSKGKKRREETEHREAMKRLPEELDKAFRSASYGWDATRDCDVEMGNTRSNGDKMSSETKAALRDFVSASEQFIAKGGLSDMVARKQHTGIMAARLENLPTVIEKLKDLSPKFIDVLQSKAQSSQDARVEQRSSEFKQFAQGWVSDQCLEKDLEAAWQSKAQKSQDERVERAHTLVRDMVQKGLLTDDGKAIKEQMEAIMSWPDAAFESMGRVVDRKPTIETAFALCTGLSNCLCLSLDCPRIKKAATTAEKSAGEFDKAMDRLSLTKMQCSKCWCNCLCDCEEECFCECKCECKCDCAPMVARKSHNGQNKALNWCKCPRKAVGDCCHMDCVVETCKHSGVMTGRIEDLPEMIEKLKDLLLKFGAKSDEYNEAYQSLIKEYPEQKRFTVAQPAAKANPSQNFAVGDTVRILDGVYVNFYGTIMEELPNQMLKVKTSIFGRDHIIAVGVAQVGSKAGSFVPPAMQKKVWQDYQAVSDSTPITADATTHVLPAIKYYTVPGVDYITVADFEVPISTTGFKYPPAEDQSVDVDVSEFNELTKPVVAENDPDFITVFDSGDIDALRDAVLQIEKADVVVEIKPSKRKPTAKKQSKPAKKKAAKQSAKKPVKKSKRKAT